MSLSPASIEQLKGDLDRGQVVLVVGSGVSVAACRGQEVDGHKVATWKGLLEHGVDRLCDLGAADGREDLMRELIRSGQTDMMISAAEIISKRLKVRSAGTYRGWLAETIGALILKDSSLLDEIAALPAMVATLNYDHLLEKATGLPAITWKESNAVEEVLNGRSKAILHLHGEYKQPETVVLGMTSYINVKEDLHATAVLQCFSLAKTLLFVGCGDTLEDPNFQQLITWGSRALKDSAPRHWLLCRASDIAAFQKKLVEAPWLRPIAYGDAYDDLGQFLRSLQPSRDNASGSVGPGTNPDRQASCLDLAGYRQAMAKFYERLKLEELDATSSDLHRGIRVTEVFIPPTARECAEFLPLAMELPKEQQRRLLEQGNLDGAKWDEETVDRFRRAYWNRTPRPMLEVMAEPLQRKLVVLGDPGSGKSLLLQYLVLAWAETSTPPSSDAPVPLLIELRDYASRRAKGEVHDILDYLGRAESLRWRLDPQALESWMRQNPSRLLLDGLDEIFDSPLRQEVTTAIHRFAEPIR